MTLASLNGSDAMRVDAVDTIVVGGGPNGIACAYYLQRAGLRVAVLERGHVVDSFRRYPVAMRFNSMRERMAVGGMPFEQPADQAPDPWPGAWLVDRNPTRVESIAYYERIITELEIPVRTGRRVTRIEPLEDGAGFAVTAERAPLPDEGPRPGPYEPAPAVGVERYLAQRVVVATGNFDTPNRLGLPGEDLPHVTHYFGRAEDYIGKRVVVIGGTSSAHEAALMCRWAGADVTLIHRREGFYASPTSTSPPRLAMAEAWRSGSIRCVMRAQVREITPDAVLVEPVSPEQRRVVIPPTNTAATVADPTGPAGALAPEETIVRLGPPIEASERIPADAVLLMTGYRSDRTLLRHAGVRFHIPNGDPVRDPESCETNIPGLFVVGAAGNPEGTGNRVGITMGLPQVERAMTALVAGLLQPAASV